MKTITAFTKLIVLTIVFVATSCKDDDPVTPNNPPPNDPVPVLATVSTSEITIFTKTTATIEGKVISDGNSAIIEKGICFGTTSAPTIANTKIDNGSGIGNISVNVTGLSLNTTYYLRAYAINKAGTAYGNEIVFTTSGLDIYLAGGTENNAGYWKNGVYTALTTANTGSFATSNTIAGNDVNATGSDGNFLVTWKNGVMTKLTDGTSVNSTAADIAVNGSDVYVGGWEAKANGPAVAKYWKNGVEVSLSDGTNDAQVSAIFISGSDVYASGYEAKNGIGVATLWKNGVIAHITDGTRHAFATSVFVNGNDVYVGGFERTADNIMVAKYWKNGITTELSDGTTHHMVNDIVVKDNVVYTTGFNYSADFTNGSALLWKGTELTTLPSDISLGYGQGRKVYTSGSDVYVYGLNGDETIIWKNGSSLEPYNGTFSTTNYVADMFLADK